MPGRASWSRSGDAVTLEFASTADGPVGVELVSAWPPPGEPPWLGHRIENVTVLSGGRVQVRFGVPRGEVLDEPERIFADPRLSGAALATAEGDARDAIDAGLPRLMTRHDASIEYARSLDRTVRLVSFDRLYAVVFAGDAGMEEAVDLGGAIGEDWSVWGASGARRLASMDWSGIVTRCGAGEGGDERGQARDEPRAGTGAGRTASEDTAPTVSYPEGDRAARQIAEQVVSLSMRTDAHGALVRALTGSHSGLAVRGVSVPSPGRAPTDVAATVALQAGPGHPCSHYAEALRRLAEWEPRRDARRTNVVLAGEAALFEIGEPAGFYHGPPGDPRSGGPLHGDPHASRVGGPLPWPS